MKAKDRSLQWRWLAWLVALTLTALLNQRELWRTAAGMLTPPVRPAQGLAGSLVINHAKPSVKGFEADQGGNVAELGVKVWACGVYQRPESILDGTAIEDQIAVR